MCQVDEYVCVLVFVCARMFSARAYVICCCFVGFRSFIRFLFFQALGPRPLRAAWANEDPLHWCANVPVGGDIDLIFMVVQT